MTEKTKWKVVIEAKDGVGNTHQIVHYILGYTQLDAGVGLDLGLNHLKMSGIFSEFQISSSTKVAST